MSCDRKKSRFAHRDPSVEASTFANELAYEESDALSVLGLCVPLGGSSRPSLKDFCLKTVKVRIRLIVVWLSRPAFCASWSSMRRWRRL